MIMDPYSPLHTLIYTFRLGGEAQNRIPQSPCRSTNQLIWKTGHARNLEKSIPIKCQFLRIHWEISKYVFKGGKSPSLGSGFRIVYLNYSRISHKLSPKYASWLNDRSVGLSTGSGAGSGVWEICIIIRFYIPNNYSLDVTFKIMFKTEWNR